VSPEADRPGSGGRLYLSPPHLIGNEADLLLDAVESNWVAPLGPHVDAFEAEAAATTGRAHGAALVSGTAAVHLALLLAGVRPGDDVLCSTLTFVGSANPIVYAGARPVFVDSEPATWNMDPGLLAGELARRAAAGSLPAAVVVVDLYGQCADYDRILPVCAEYGVPVIEDAAEALGASSSGRPAGSFGESAILSFNGNKIITTSGGGMLVTDDGERAARARFLASQARDPALHYEHSEVGFNYRMSNLLAALGRAQLATLDDRVAARRANFDAYAAGLGDIGGVRFMPEPDGSRSNRWLTVLTLDRNALPASNRDVIAALAEHDIEARPVWKPMHLQPVFADAPMVGGAVAETLFDEGLCLPSGSQMTGADRERVIEIVRAALGAG
jgi:dTDP-4-amino-4,6-dideoxygalactose transaminase